MHLRERVAEGGEVTRQGARVTLRPAGGHAAERAALRAARWVFEHPGALRAAERLASGTRRLHPSRPRLSRTVRAWSDTRDLPEVPAEPFRDWWRRTKGTE